jgi:hypothetical protein
LCPLGRFWASDHQHDHLYRRWMNDGTKHVIVVNRMFTDVMDVKEDICARGLCEK